MPSTQFQYNKAGDAMQQQLKKRQDKFKRSKGLKDFSKITDLQIGGADMDKIE